MNAQPLAEKLRKQSGAKLLLPDGTPLCVLRVARGVLRRGIGLMGRAHMPPACGDGLLFLNCRDLQTCFMRFPLDIAFLDNAGACLEIRRGVKSWKCVRGPGNTRHVFEVTAGMLDSTDGGGWQWEPAEV